MRIGVVGFGYVGSAVAHGFRKEGHTVCVYDIADIALKKARAERYRAYNKLETLIDNSECIFICVPTPPNRNGSNDSSIVRRTVENIARLCKKETIVVIKSTVMVGTTDKLIDMANKKNKTLHIFFSPEFLTAKKAYKNFLHSDRIVIGGYDTKPMAILHNLHKNFSEKILLVDPNTAELAKYASNSFLATKVSFTNQIKFICKRMKVDSAKVMEIVGLDKRIGHSHLDPNKGGFTGSCLPKDLDAFIFETSKVGVDNRLLKAVKEINEKVVKVNGTDKKPNINI